MNLTDSFSTRKAILKIVAIKLSFTVCIEESLDSNSKEPFHIGFESSRIENKTILTPKFDPSLSETYFNHDPLCQSVDGFLISWIFIPGRDACIKKA